MYVCGPTVYDDAHLGHAKLYVAMDVVVRYLRYVGYRVRHVQNLTDVGHLLDTGEDRVVRRARRKRVEPMELAEVYARSFFEDMDALGVAPPNISARASCHLPEQIELIKTLLEDGTADQSYIADLDPYREAFLSAMGDDFSTARAVAALHDLAHQVSRWLADVQPLSRGTLAAIDGMFRELGGQVLGLIPRELTPPGVDGGLIEGLMNLILDIRREYRVAKDWERADALRGRMAELGIAIEDRVEGPTWRLEQ